MALEAEVAAHYGRSDLEALILGALQTAGLDLEKLTPADLAPADVELVDRREATSELAGRLEIVPGLTLLDIGAGIGGPARYFAAEWGCRVTGIDLTPAFVAAATALTRRVGLDDKVTFREASAAALPFPDASFDRATLIHVGMNLPDKPTAFREVRRVLRPGGLFGLYEVMRVGEGGPNFPVPWASTAEQSFLSSPDEYRAALAETGFTVLHERDRRAFAREFFARMRARIQAEGPPAVGLHVLVGPSWSEWIGNVVAALEAGTIAPVEMIARPA